MRRGFERTMQVLLWGVGVTIVWAAIALTGWGRERSPLGAGPGYLDAVAPLTYVAGALLVSVSATLLIQMAATARKQKGRPARRRSTPSGSANPAARPVSDRIAQGRTWSDLPVRPPAPDNDPPHLDSPRARRCVYRERG